MSIYIGGDSQELSFDFGLKVANSVAECPLRLFRGEVSPDSLPPPTDGVWTEVTSQTMLSKLASQNELPVTAIASDKSTVTWNSKTLPKTSTLKCLDDFVGKIANSTVENPHRIYDSICTTLQNPSNYTNNNLTGFNDWFNRTQVQLDKLSTLNGVTTSYGTTSIGQIPQQLFSFNIIEMVERRFGSIPKETVAEKVAWLKSNLSRTTCNAYIYGINPTGNKAYLKCYDTVSGWVGTWNNTASSPSNVQSTYETSIFTRLDDNGFVHFLAYTDSARTTDSTLLVLSGHGLSNSDVIENTTHTGYSSVTKGTDNTLITGTITGQTSGDSIKKFKYTGAGNIKTITAIDGNNITIPSHGLSTGDFIKNTSRSWTLRKVTVVDANTITLDSAITGQIVGDSIAFYTLYGTQTAESTVIPSTIYTDYVSLELTLKAPENLITATNTLSDIVTDFTGKVAGSVVENANVGKVTSVSSSLLSPSLFTTEYAQINYDRLEVLDSSNAPVTVNTNGQIPQQLFSFNIVAAVEKQLGQPIPAVDKVQWCKDNINTITGSWYGYGSCPSGNKAYFSFYRNNAWNIALSNVAVTPSALYWGITNFTTYPIIQDDGMVHFLAYTDASDGNTASTIFTDYVKLTIKLKYIPTYNFYTDSNTRRDAGLTDIVLVKRTIGDMVSDFAGKVYNDVVSNPNIAKRYMTNAFPTTLIAPSSFGIEYLSTGEYDTIKTLNGACMTSTDSTLNHIAQQLFQFNLIEIAQRALGTSIPGVDTASKVQWLKDNLNSVKYDWTGFGSSPLGNKAYTRAYDNVAVGWGATIVNNTASTPTLNTCTYTTTIANIIDATGFVNILAYTDSSNGTVASVISTDYVKLTLTFKNDTVGYEFFTNNSSEVSVATNAKASSLLIEAQLDSVCNTLVGGSNSALKALIKSTSNIDFYSLGTGSNVNQLGYGVTLKAWNGTAWVTVGSNTNQNIQKVNATFTNSYLDTSNKIYFLLHSNYKSDGNIGSEIVLDYCNIKVLLTRINDVIQAIPITL